MGTNLTLSPSEQAHREIVRLVADLAKIEPAEVRADADLRDVIGLRSLDVLVLRETLERTFGIRITDADMMQCSTVSSLEQLVSAHRAPQDVAAESLARPTLESRAEAGPPGSVMRADGSLQTDVEISMQLLGQNGLSETPLLMRIADLRWQHMASVANVLTREVVDADGDRLYAAVFFVETRFPTARPLGTFIENDRISIISTLARFGTTFLDGIHYLLPFEPRSNRAIAPASPEIAETQQIPWIRISNSFVKKWDGAAWLKKSRPVAEGFNRIRELGEPPSSHQHVEDVREKGRFFDIPETYVHLTEEPAVVPYDIVPDRDLNGAGLLYFAVYPVIMDIAERHVLASAGALAFDHALIDRRTLVQRKTAYLSNAAADDQLQITMQIYVESPFRSSAAEPEMAPIRLIEEIRLNRLSDGRLIGLSAAKKVIMGTTLGETRLFEELARLK